MNKQLIIGYTPGGKSIFTNVKHKKRSMFFPQVRDLTVDQSLTGGWIFVSPVTREHGCETIEECEDLISRMEQSPLADPNDEWRIKEVRI